MTIKTRKTTVEPTALAQNVVFEPTLEVINLDERDVIHDDGPAVRPTISRCLDAIEICVEEGLELSDAIEDPARVSWTAAIAIISYLRGKLREVGSVVQEARRAS